MQERIDQLKKTNKVEEFEKKLKQLIHIQGSFVKLHSIKKL